MENHLSALSNTSIAVLTTFILAGALYLVGLSVYRLYLSPLSHFPGPKLAALTKWYEFYYDVLLQGQFTFRIQKMHKRYGMKRTLFGIAVRSDFVAKVQLSESPPLNFTWKTVITGMSFTPVLIDMINMRRWQEGSALIL